MGFAFVCKEKLKLMTRDYKNIPIKIEAIYGWIVGDLKDYIIENINKRGL